MPTKPTEKEATKNWCLINPQDNLLLKREWMLMLRKSKILWMSRLLSSNCPAPTNQLTQLMKPWIWSKTIVISEKEATLTRSRRKVILEVLKRNSWMSKTKMWETSWLNSWRMSLKCSSMRAILSPLQILMMNNSWWCLMRMTLKILLWRLTPRTLTVPTLKHGMNRSKGKPKKWKKKNKF